MSLSLTGIPANSTAAIDGAQNNMNATNCRLKLEEWIVTVVPVYLLVIVVLGIVLNVFVLMVFCLHKKPCTVAEIYLSNLAVADLVLLSCLPFWAVNISKRYNWIFGQFLCKVVYLGIKMNACCSIYFLVLVSIDRYLALVHAMSHKKMRRPKFAKLGCVLVWGLGLLLGAPALIYRKVKSKCNTTVCNLDFQSETEYFVYEGKLIMFHFIIPIPIICFCTVKIIQTLNNRLMEGLNCHRTEHKATTLVLVVLLTFLICWAPFLLTEIIMMLINAGKMIKDNSTMQIIKIWYHISINLAFFNSVLNPILYVVVGQSFRKKVKDLFMRWNHERTSTTTSLRSNLRRSVKSADFSS